MEIIGDIFRLSPVNNSDQKLLVHHMAHSHDLSEGIVRGAEEIIFWGVSGSLYDAEFLSILTQLPSSSRLKRIVIINPNKDDALRLYGIIGVPLKKFIFYDPTKNEEYSLSLD